MPNQTGALNIAHAFLWQPVCITMRTQLPFLLCLCLVGFNGTVQSTPTGKNEWTIGSGIGWILDEVDHQTRFSPYQMDGKSASRDIEFSGEEVPVFSIGYTRWITPEWGVSLNGRHSITEWSGSNQPIPIHFSYYAWQSTQPWPLREYSETVESSLAPSGSWSGYRFSAGIKRRFRVGRLDASLHASIVQDWFHDFHLENLYFQNTTMISRGILVPSKLFMELKSTKENVCRTGGSLGIAGSIPLHARVSLFADARIIWLASTHLKMSLDAIDPIETFYNAETTEQVEALAEFDPFKTPEFSLSLEAGVLLHF